MYIGAIVWQEPSRQCLVATIPVRQYNNKPSMIAALSIYVYFAICYTMWTFCILLYYYILSSGTRNTTVMKLLNLFLLQIFQWFLNSKLGPKLYLCNSPFLYPSEPPPPPPPTHSFFSLLLILLSLISPPLSSPFSALTLYRAQLQQNQREDRSVHAIDVYNSIGKVSGDQWRCYIIVQLGSVQVKT